MSLNGGVLTTCEKEGFLPLGDQSDVVFFLLFSAGAMFSKTTTATTTTTTTKKLHLKTQNPHKLHFFWGACYQCERRKCYILLSRECEIFGPKSFTKVQM